MINLSEKQSEIVNHVDGAILVKAGPGSGKTRVLIERIKKLLLSKKRCKVLALTFSNLAAEEMRNRLDEDLSLGDLTENVNIGTIHSFCLDLVQARGNLIGLEKDMVLFENNDDQQAILKEVFFNDQLLLNILKERKNQDQFLRKCLGLISEQKKNFISPEMCERTDPFPLLYKSYNEMLRQQNALDFDDILFFAYRILTENPSVVKLYNSLYHFICVDESQDLNFAQYEVIKALCGSKYKNVMFVGDENQSIYGFNGSDSTIMSNQFVKDFKPTVYLLNENYRSARAIVDYADKLENYHSTTNYVYDGELSAFKFDNEEMEAEFVLAKIQSLMANGHKDIESDLAYDDFAVIARNKYALAKMEELLKEQDIPYFYKKTVSGIENESEYMQIFELGIRIIMNSRDIVHLKELCKFLNVNISIVAEMDDAILILSEAFKDSRYEKLLSVLISINDVNFNFGKTLDSIRDKLSSSLTDEEKYLILNDIEHWKRHWLKYCGLVQRENRSLLSFRNYISLGKTQDITNDKGVALLTAHMSKGLQYEVVFVVGLSEGTFPDYRAVNNGDVEMAQEINNMYVAVTRAKRLCYLSYPEWKMMPWGSKSHQRPSRFLDDFELV